MTRRTIPYGMEAMTKPLMRAWVANDRAGGGADGDQSGGEAAASLMAGGMWASLWFRLARVAR
jgi:hypothetical protein